MTCIIGIKNNGDVFLGGDSAGIAGTDLDVRAYSKVFQTGEFIMGYSGSFRMGQLLQYKFVPPKLTKAKRSNLMAYMVCDFVDALRLCLQAGGVAHKADDVETGGNFLVGVAGRLFSIDTDYQVGEFKDDYCSIGCGSGYALGSLFTTKEFHPIERIKEALEAASHHSAGVCGPFHMVFICK